MIADDQPPDVSNHQWQVAQRGLWAFLFSGQAEKAMRLGWPNDALFGVPPVWARAELCGAGLLIEDREVVEISADAIRVKAPSGSVLAFYRKPQPDFGLVYETRLKLIRGNYPADSKEPRLGALEHTVRFCCDQTGADLEQAKKRVLATIAKAKEPPEP